MAFVVTLLIPALTSSFHLEGHAFNFQYSPNICLDFCFMIKQVGQFYCNFLSVFLCFFYLD